ncbi:MAG TPA: acyl-CoA dehydrogenase, partial [Hyphomonadaceae bacterium]|nr:acyl-CoA dehydrogenase [Hyphomonadaceae bacterium]
GVKDQSTPQVPIIEHTDVRRMLMAQKAAVEGGLSLTSYCSLLVDKQKTADTAEERAEYDDLLGLLTPVAKSWPSEHCLEANKWAIQILGGYGYTRDYPVERHYRDNRLNHIHEGTFGIQGRDLLGRKLRAGVSALTPLRNQIASTIETARAQGLNAECDQLEKALASAEKAIEAVRGCDEENLSLANATLFLDAFGTVVVAWLWLWQASVAKQASPDAGSSEETFYNGKIAAAQYFFRYELSKVVNTFELVASLDDTCELASADFFGVN